MVVVGSVDAGGRVWASLLVGEPGFLWAPDERTVRIAATPLPGDPLAEPLRRAGTKVGVIAIDLATRRHVRFMDENTLQFPDYSGNTAFNTPGNIAANPSAGPLFLDFERGVTLQLTGGARIVWDAWRAARFAGGERVVEFRLQEAVETLGAVPLRWRFRG